MVNKFWNSKNDSSEGDLGQCESTDPSNAPGRYVGGDGSDSDVKDGPEEDLEIKTKETKTQRRV